VEGVKHQQSVLELLGSQGRQFGIIQQIDQGGDVVAAQHHAQQFDRLDAIDNGGGRLTFDNGGQEGRFHIGCVIDTGGNAIGDQVKEKLSLARRRCLEQFHQLSSPLWTQGFGGYTFGGAFFYVLAVGFKHGCFLV